MTQILSKSRFIRVSPEKLRLMAGQIKGKKLSLAFDYLKFSQKQASKHLFLLLKQALAQSQDKNLDQEKLIIKQIVVNEGPKLKRRRIIHRGRATQILKRRSHIQVILDDQMKSQEKKINKETAKKEMSMVKKEGKNGTKN